MLENTQFKSQKKTNFNQINNDSIQQKNNILTVRHKIYNSLQNIEKILENITQFILYNRKTM